MPPKSASPTIKKSQRLGKTMGGRKELPEADRRTRRVVVRFTEADFAALEEQSAQSGRPLAVILRARLTTLPAGKTWTAEQFRLCRTLASLYEELRERAGQAEENGEAKLSAATKVAAEQVSALLDSLA